MAGVSAERAAWDKSQPRFAQIDGCELLLHSKLCFQVEFQVKSEVKRDGVKSGSH